MHPLLNTAFVILLHLLLWSFSCTRLKNLWKTSWITDNIWWAAYGFNTWKHLLKRKYFRSFHVNPPHTYHYWRHYSYKWTFVLKECRVCRRVGGWEGDSGLAVCRGLLFSSWLKPLTKLSSPKQCRPVYKYMIENNPPCISAHSVIEHFFWMHVILTTRAFM